MGNYPLTKEECLKIGGHCYELEPFVLDTSPPIHVQVCKHCGHRQHGIRQPNFEWRDRDG